jgi:phytoene synthase
MTARRGCRQKSTTFVNVQENSHCEALVRAADRDRYLATLFAPAEHREALYALYAFNVEIMRVREVIREPLAGELRLQWWCDGLAGSSDREFEAHPVAAALLAALKRHGLSGHDLLALIDARRFDVYTNPMATYAELQSYADGASSKLFEFAARVLAGPEPDLEALAHHAGVAHAIAGLLAAFPMHVARGQLYVPAEVLARHGTDRQGTASGKATPQLRGALAELRQHARRHLAAAHALYPAAPASVLPALLPLASVPLLLKRMNGPGYDPFAPIEISPWRRQWLIWRAARKPERLFG